MLNRFLKNFVVIILWIIAMSSLILTAGLLTWWSWIPWLTVGAYFYDLFQRDLKKRLFDKKN